MVEMTEKQLMDDRWLQAVFSRTTKAGDNYEAFEEQASSVGFCSHPVRLKGHVLATDIATGERRVAYGSGDAVDGSVAKACENRRSSRCKACV